MKFTARKICVDAGMIMIADLSFLKTCPSTDKDQLDELGQIFKIPNGTYRIHWSIDDTYNGDVEGTQELKVTTGKVFVCDPCYIIGRKNNDWCDWLKKTNYCEEINDPRAFIIDEMGGDGSYDICLETEEL